MSDYLTQLRALRSAPGVVVTDPRSYYADAGRLSLAHPGDFRIFAGTLVELWADGKLVLPCQCGGRVFIHTMGGSPLSGTHYWSGSCTRCRTDLRGPKGGDRVHFDTLYRPVLDRLGDRALAYRDTPNGYAPLTAVADIALGGFGAVYIALRGRRDGYSFEWSTGILRDVHRRVVLRIDEQSVSLAPGAAAWAWDGATLRLSDGAPAARVRRHDPRPIDHALLAGGAADFARVPSRQIETWIDSPRGEPRYRVSRTGLHDVAGVCRVSWSATVPLGVALILVDHADLLEQLANEGEGV